MTPPKQTIEEAAEALLQEFKADTNYSERWTVDEIFLAGAAFALNSDEVRGLVKALRSINVQQIVNGKVGQELRATEISERLATFDAMKAQVGGE